MFAETVKERESLRERKHSWSGELKPGDNPLKEIRGELFDINAATTPGKGAEIIELQLRGVPLVYDVTKQELSCRHVKAPLALGGGKLVLRVLVDRGSIEVYGNHGEVAMSIAAIANQNDRSLGLAARGASARVVAIEVFE